MRVAPRGFIAAEPIDSLSLVGQSLEHSAPFALAKLSILSASNIAGGSIGSPNHQQHCRITAKRPSSQQKDTGPSSCLAWAKQLGPEPYLNQPFLFWIENMNHGVLPKRPRRVALNRSRDVALDELNPSQARSPILQSRVGSGIGGTRPRLPAALSTTSMACTAGLELEVKTLLRSR